MRWNDAERDAVESKERDCEQIIGRWKLVSIEDTLRIHRDVNSIHRATLSMTQPGEWQCRSRGAATAKSSFQKKSRRRLRKRKLRRSTVMRPIMGARAVDSVIDVLLLADKP